MSTRAPSSFDMTRHGRRYSAAMLDVIRASSLQGFPEVVRELGGDPVRLLRASGIDPAVVGDHEAYLHYRDIAAVLERAASVLACPDFGLRLSTRQGIDVLGPVALIARHAQTVGEGMQGLAKYLHVYSPAIGIAVDPLRDGEARFTFTILTIGLPVRAQAEELSLGVALRVFRLLIGERFRPLRVALPHAPLSAPAEYRRFFDTAVEFEQARSGFDLAADLLDRQVDRDGAVVRGLAARYLETAELGGDRSVEGTLRRLIARTLPTGHCTIGALAAELAVHPRTLQRRLADEGVSFGELVEAVRRDQAYRYLVETTMPLGRLAALLGYSEQSSLSRACRGWFGDTPRNVRRAGARPRSPGVAA